MTKVNVTTDLPELTNASAALSLLLDTVLEPEQIISMLDLDKKMDKELKLHRTMQKNAGKLVKKLEIPSEAIDNKSYASAALAVEALGQTDEHKALAKAFRDIDAMSEEPIVIMDIEPIVYDQIKALKPKGSIIKHLGPFIKL